jgi:hypothetical protein
LPRKEAVGIAFASTDHILPIDGHRGAIVRGMIGTTGFKGIKAIQSGLNYKGSPRAHTIVPNINRIANVVEVTVQWKVQVDFISKIHLL